MEIRYYGDKLSQRIAKTPEGFLICQDVPISRTGYQEYLAKELIDDPVNGNKIIPVYRPAKEVFDIRSLASFEGKPVTNEHPDEDVTPENYQQYSCGHVQNVHVGDGEDSNKVLADLYITDPTLIHLIENGKREVSCGYYAEEKKDSDGRLYQTKIRGNHVAIVRSGRAGKRICIRDSKTPKITNHVETLSDHIDGLHYINDEGKKGMKKGQHVMARDPEYTEYLKGVGMGQGADIGAGIGMGTAAARHGINYIRGIKNPNSKYGAFREFLKQHPKIAVPSMLAGIAGNGIVGGLIGGAAGYANEKYQNSKKREALKRKSFDSLNKFNGDSNMNYYDDDELMYDDDEILEDDDELMYDDDEILEDDDELMYDDDEILEDDDEILEDDDEILEDDDEILEDDDEILEDDDEILEDDDEILEDDDEILEDDDEILEDDDELMYDDDELLIQDEGKKGMKRGQHVMARDPDYLAALKGGAAGAGIGAGAGVAALGGALTAGHFANKYNENFNRVLADINGRDKVKARIAAEPYYKKTGAMLGEKIGGLYRHRGKVLGGAALLGAGIGAYRKYRKNRGDSWYHDDDEIMYDDDEIMYDDDELLEDGCRYEDDEDLMYDDDELLEDDDIDGVVSQANELVSDARYTLNKIKQNLNRINRLYDSQIVNDDDEILEDDDEILEDDDEILEDDDEILEDDDEILEDDDEILEDDDEILEDDDEILEDDDEILEDENPESEVIDTDKAAALRKITEASRDITDPNERKHVQDAIYGALCGRNQMADVMRITQKARANRMDSAYGNKGKVDLNQQQSIYDSFNPHKKTSF